MDGPPPILFRPFPHLYFASSFAPRTPERTEGRRTARTPKKKGRSLSSLFYSLFIASPTVKRKKAKPSRRSTVTRRQSTDLLRKTPSPPSFPTAAASDALPTFSVLLSRISRREGRLCRRKPPRQPGRQISQPPRHFLLQPSLCKHQPPQPFRRAADSPSVATDSPSVAALPPWKLRPHLVTTIRGRIQEKDAAAQFDAAPLHRRNASPQPPPRNQARPSESSSATVGFVEGGRRSTVRVRFRPVNPISINPNYFKKKIIKKKILRVGLS